jgi:hypothetical protein
LSDGVLKIARFSRPGAVSDPDSGEEEGERGDGGSPLELLLSDGELSWLVRILAVRSHRFCFRFSEP